MNVTNKQRLTAGFVALYLVVQIAAPALGVQARQDGIEAFPFSWHMFSTIDDADR